MLSKGRITFDRNRVDKVRTATGFTSQIHRPNKQAGARIMWGNGQGGGYSYSLTAQQHLIITCTSLEISWSSDFAKAFSRKQSANIM
jgi:hypothetical protein